MSFPFSERTWHLRPMKKGKKATIGARSTDAEVAQGLVRQMGSMGCGVACVASVLRISYARALTRFQKVGVKGDDVRVGFSRPSLSAPRTSASRLRRDLPQRRVQGPCCRLPRPLSSPACSSRRLSLLALAPALQSILRFLMKTIMRGDTSRPQNSEGYSIWSSGAFAGYKV